MVDFTLLLLWFNFDDDDDEVLIEVELWMSEGDEEDVGWALMYEGEEESCLLVEVFMLKSEEFVCLYFDS